MSLQELILKKESERIVNMIKNLNDKSKFLGINTYCILNTIIPNLDAMKNNIDTIDKNELIEYLLFNLKNPNDNSLNHLDDKNIYVTDYHIYLNDKKPSVIYRKKLTYAKLCRYLVKCIDFFNKVTSYSLRIIYDKIKNIDLKIYKDSVIVFDFFISQ